jgi:type IX secretion system PorP/SprF family membrane protein
MTKHIAYFLLFIATFITPTCRAQQQPLYTQYMFNGLAINPAYAGSQETFVASALFRKQWVGIEDAPQTQSFSAHSPLDKLRNGKRPISKVSVGLSVFDDRIAITRQTGIFGIYAYRLTFNNKATLSMGVQAGLSQMQINYSELSLDDPSFLVGDIRKLAPNFGGGVYYSTQRFYAGLSVPHLLHQTWDETGTNTSLHPQYFLTTGYVLDLQSSMKLKPNLLIKHIKGNPIQFDLNCNLFLSDRVECGVSWRSFESFSAMIQVAVNSRFRVGYAYDMPVASELSTSTSGSHEMMVSYRAPLKTIRSVNPRYF